VALPPCHTGPFLLNRRRGSSRGKTLQAPGRSPDGAGGARGRGLGRLGCPRSGEGPSLAFPLGRTQSRARTGPRRACRPGGPAAPRPARAGAARPAVQGGVARCAGVMDEDKEVLPHGAHAPEVEEEGMAAQRVPPGSASGWKAAGVAWWATAGAGPAVLDGLHLVLKRWPAHLRFSPNLRLCFEFRS
jgi:hypothetical protein